MQTDPIADFITVVRNAMIGRQMEAVVPHSKMREAIARILSKEGFIERFEVFGEKQKQQRFKYLRVHMRYYDDLRQEGPLHKIARVSKPSRRVYADATHNRPMRGGVGIRILSTSRGVMTDIEARRKNIGGEVLVEVW
ncbi:MAG: 30S ribosomal protein S8 [Candidatus Riflebacteria bacterium RBG_13_59_9]|nr:MAG: 30S ribosomal protein S8 [Candidatus Riflebacteria bacterium RBG_13_59_9]